MLVRNIIAILGASALAAANPEAPAVTALLTGTGGGVVVPTTLVPVPLPSANASSTAAPSGLNNSTSSALGDTTTVTSRVVATKTVTLRPAKTNSYEACGAFRPSPKPCPASFECIKNPFEPGCGPACDQPGICVVPIMCGGIAGIKCPKGKFCVDDPRDDCSQKTGGADCAGICL
ncbi:hypothetical protein LX36DRAFT_707557 [Colletotrichum falcatum]|nr:hypothetical protein LX36DRAFT_707557 [Colletotrichum falcatum]